MTSNAAPNIGALKNPSPETRHIIGLIEHLCSANVVSEISIIQLIDYSTFKIKIIFSANTHLFISSLHSIETFQLASRAASE